MMLRVVLISLALLTASGLSGQEVALQQYVFFLEDGSKLKGELVSLTADSMVFRILGGQSVGLQRREVVRFLPEGEAPAENPPAKRPYAFEEQGFFHLLSFGANFVRTSTDGMDLGLSLHYALGFQFNRWLGAGVGSGLDSYSLRNRYQLVPVFLHLRSFLGRTKVAPMLLLDAGYGFALTDRDAGITESRGGWLLHPAVGVRFGAHPKVNFAMDIGYRFQRASYTEDFFIWNPGQEQEERNLLFQRFTLRFNLLF